MAYLRLSLSEKTNDAVSYKPVKFERIRRFGDELMAGTLLPDLQLFVANQDFKGTATNKFSFTKGETFCRTSAVGENGIAVSRPYPSGNCNVLTGIVDQNMLVLKERNQWTCEDVCEYCVKVALSSTTKYYSDLLSKEDKSNVRKKDFDKGVFISYARKMKFIDFIDTLVYHFGDEADKVYIWTDIFCGNQVLLTMGNVEENLKKLIGSLLTNGLHQAITKFDRRVVVLDNMFDPIILQRLWCVWEIFGVAKAKQQVEVAAGPAAVGLYLSTLKKSIIDEQFVEHLTKLNVENAKCFNQDDYNMITRAIEETCGYSEVNSVVLDEIRKGFINKASSEVIRLKAFNLKHEDLPIMMCSTAQLMLEYGDLATALGQVDEAIALLNKADPNYVVALNILAKILIKKGSMDKAIIKLNEAIGIEDGRKSDKKYVLGDLYRTLGEAYYELKNLDSALHFLRLAEDTLGNYVKFFKIYDPENDDDSLVLGKHNPVDPEYYTPLRIWCLTNALIAMVLSQQGGHDSDEVAQYANKWLYSQNVPQNADSLLRARLMLMSGSVESVTFGDPNSIAYLVTDALDTLERTLGKGSPEAVKWRSQFGAILAEVKARDGEGS